MSSNEQLNDVTISSGSTKATPPSKLFSFIQTVSNKAGGLTQIFNKFFSSTPTNVANESGASQSVVPKKNHGTTAPIPSNENQLGPNDGTISEPLLQHACKIESSGSSIGTKDNKSTAVGMKIDPKFELPTLPNKVRVRIMLSGSIVVPLKSKPNKPKMSNSKSSTKKSSRPPRPAALLDYMMKGILLPGIGVLTARGMENEVTADLTADGKIIFDGVTYTSPSAFARVPLRKSHCNGWANTMYAQPGNPWKTLMTIRAEIAKKGISKWKLKTSAGPKQTVNETRSRKTTPKPTKMSVSMSAKTIAKYRQPWMRLVNDAGRWRITPHPNKTDAPVPTAAARSMKIRPRRQDFNWQFYETESRLLLGTSSPPLQTTTPKSTSSPTQAPEGGASAAVAGEQIAQANKSTTNNCKRRKLTARKSSSYYYTARYFDC